VGVPTVANFSFDFEHDLSHAQSDAIADMVRHTPSILYVVAADNRPTRYRSGHPYSLPVGLNAEDNVLVVTALNEAGTGVWDSAAPTRPRPPRADRRRRGRTAERQPRARRDAGQAVRVRRRRRHLVRCMEERCRAPRVPGLDRIVRPRPDGRRQAQRRTTVR